MREFSKKNFGLSLSNVKRKALISSKKGINILKISTMKFLFWQWIRSREKWKQQQCGSHTIFLLRSSIESVFIRIYYFVSCGRVNTASQRCLWPNLLNLWIHYLPHIRDLIPIKLGILEMEGLFWIIWMAQCYHSGGQREAGGSGSERKGDMSMKAKGAMAMWYSMGPGVKIASKPQKRWGKSLQKEHRPASTLIFALIK